MDYKKKIESFTGLRFIMISTIIINHIYYLAFIDSIGHFYTKFFQNSIFAVNFFFILSGFGMMFGYLKRCPDSEVVFPSIISNIKYAINHIKKIYPVYLFAIIIGLIFLIISTIQKSEMSSSFVFREFVRLIIHCLLLQSATCMTFFTHAYNGVSWFISSLFCIYLISPFLMTLLRKISKSYYVSLALIVFNIVTILILFKLFGQFELFMQNKGISKVDNLVYGSPYIRVFYVLIGMNAALFFNQIENKIQTASQTFFSIIEILISLITIIYYFSRNSLTPAYYDFRPLMDILLPAMIIVIFSFDKGCISNKLKNPKIQLLGNMSMYFYLIHPIFIIQLSLLLENHITWSLLTAFFYTILSIALTFIISLLFYKNSKK